MLVFQYALSLIIAYIMGNIARKFKIPAVIAWLITGIILGPNLLNLFSQKIIDTNWHGSIAILCHMTVGSLIGVNLRWEDLKKTGSDIVKLNLFQVSGSFIVVFIVAYFICKIFNISILIALLIASISVTLAPAPPVTIIEQYKTKGPLTNTIIPITMTDSIISSIIFYTMICIVRSRVSVNEMTLFTSLSLIIFIPIILGLLSGKYTSRFISKKNTARKNQVISFGLLVILTILGYFIDNYLYPEPMMNYILLGLGFIVAMVNSISLDLIEEFKSNWKPINSIGLIIVIINSSVPINVKLFTKVGYFSVIYLMARSFGRIGGNYIGARLIQAPDVVRKYGGILTLPHLGLSLIYTSIAVEVAEKISPKAAGVMALALPLATLINELIALNLAKKVYQWAGEANLQD